MNFSVSGIAAGLIFGTIGMYLVGRAKRLAHIPSLVIGVALMVYPYFVASNILLWGIGAVLVYLACQLAKAS